MNALVILLVVVGVTVTYSAPVAEYDNRQVSDVISPRDELVLYINNSVSSSSRIVK